MRTFQTPRRSIAAPRFNAPSNTACAVLCALCLTSGMAQANPLMILGGINGVVDAVKRTTGSLVKESKPSAKPTAQPRISLPSAHRITRNMQRDAVIALVGEPTQSNNADGRTVGPREVYKVKREGSCTVDEIAITYAANNGPIQEILQRCGDVTSNENRSVRYAYHLEFPEVFDQLSPKMPREQVMAILGTPADTRASNTQSMFIDAYTVDGAPLDVWYDKAEKRVYQFYWSTRHVSLPRIKRAELFEPTDRP